MMRVTAIISAATAIATAALLALPVTNAVATGNPSRPVTVRSGSSAQPVTTVLVFRVAHCGGCRIGVQRALFRGSHVRPPRPRYWDGPSGVVHHGRLVLTVPTRYTTGMSFTLTAPWQDDVTNAVTNVVLGYPDRAARTPLSKSRARHATVATACWAGTSKARTHLHLKVARVHGKILGGGRGVTPLVWASPTTHTIPGTAAHTWKGTLANQDAYYC